jgi:hypothetical protein
MNKKILYSTLVLLLVIGGFFLFSKKSKPDTIQEDYSLLHITSLAPDVFLSVPGMQETLIEKTATTSLGAVVRTGKSGRALVEAPEKRIALDSDTTLTLSKSTDTTSGTIVALTTGSVWSRIEKVFEKGEYYEVKTQNAVASVRGTSFNVSYENGTTTLIVVESAVAFVPLDSVDGKTLKDKTVIVSAGKYAIRRGFGEIEVYDIRAEDISSNWYQFNAGTPIKEKVYQSEGVDSPVTSPAGTAVNPGAPGSPPQPAQTPTQTTIPKPTSSQGGGGGKVPEIPISIKSANPAQISSKSGGAITIYGGGFTNAVFVTVVLNKAQEDPVHISDFKIVDDTTITGSLPPNLPPGRYDVVVGNNKEEGSTLFSALSVF